MEKLTRKEKKALNDRKREVCKYIIIDAYNAVFKNLKKQKTLLYAKDPEMFKKIVFDGVVKSLMTPETKIYNELFNQSVNMAKKELSIN